VGAEDGAFVEQVIDDGLGFDAQELATRALPGHMGMRTMQQRAQAAGGPYHPNNGRWSSQGRLAGIVHCAEGHRMKVAGARSSGKAVGRLGDHDTVATVYSLRAESRCHYGQPDCNRLKRLDLDATSALERIEKERQTAQKRDGRRNLTEHFHPFTCILRKFFRSSPGDREPRLGLATPNLRPHVREQSLHRVPRGRPGRRADEAGDRRAVERRGGIVPRIQAEGYDLDSRGRFTPAQLSCDTRRCSNEIAVPVNCCPLGEFELEHVPERPAPRRSEGTIPADEVMKAEETREAHTFATPRSVHFLKMEDVSLVRSLANTFAEFGASDLAYRSTQPFQL